MAVANPVDPDMATAVMFLVARSFLGTIAEGHLMVMKRGEVRLE